MLSSFAAAWVAGSEHSCEFDADTPVNSISMRNRGSLETGTNDAPQEVLSAYTSPHGLIFPLPWVAKQ